MPKLSDIIGTDGFGAHVIEAVNAAAIVSISDVSGAIVYANENFCEISGYSKEELIGRHHRIVNSGMHDQSIFVEMWKTITAGDIWQGEIKNKRKDGTFYWVYSTIVPIKNQSNQICYYVSVRHDITAQKEVQAQLIQASKLSALGEATAKIAHELNNPLAVIFGLTQMLLKRGDLSEKSQEQTVKVQKAAERMNRLIQQMKKHSRNSSEDPKQVLILGEIINNSLILVEGSLKNNGIGLTVTIPEEPFQIFGDVVQIESVIQNLITNSVDAFNKPHSGNEIRDRKIQLGLKNEGDFAVLSYEDNAGGIPESVQKHMFDTFFTTKEAGKGTGLGLSMIKSIIQEHQAQLSFSSELGKGTRFVIKFPRYPCKESLKTIKSAV